MGTVPGPGNLYRRVLFFSFMVILFGAYSNTFTSPPLLDDYHSFIFEKSLYLDQLSISSILNLTQSKFGYTRYIPVITLALNHKLGQSNLIYFHAVNILIHLLSFLAVYFLAKQIFAIASKCKTGENPGTLVSWLPLLIAGLWALNPVQTNAVTYLVQRMASLVGLFYFMTVGCYIKARLYQQEGKKNSSTWYLGMLLFALCAVLSKENSVMLPFSLVLVEICFFDSFFLQKTWEFLRKRNWKFWFTIGIAGVICLFYGFNIVGAKALSGYENRHFTISERLLTEGRIVIWYISLLFYPNPSRLCVEHYVDLSTSLVSPPTTLPALLLIAALIGGSLYLRRKYPVICFGILWYFLNISLESTIIPLELVFEHRLYIPSFGIFLSVIFLSVTLFRAILRKMPESEFTKAFCSTIIVLVCCSALLTFMRNEDWQTSLSIHEDIATKAPELPRSNANYANALLAARQFDGAIKFAERAMALSKPGLESYSVAANAIITAYLFTGRKEEAIEKGKELIAQFPKKFDADSFPLIRLNMAQAYMGMKDEKNAYDQILESFKLISQIDQSSQKKDASYGILRQLLVETQQRGIDLNGDGKVDPGDVPVDFWIAMELQKIGEHAYARQLLEREHSRNPENALVSAEIQKYTKEDELNRVQKEKWNFDRKYVSHPFSKFNFCMAVAFLAEEKNLPKFFKNLGEKCLNIAFEMNPNSADALLLKGWYLYSDENAQEAVAAARKALEYDPDNAKAWLGLGFFLIKAGSPQDAIAAFDKVIEIYPSYSNRPMIEALTAQLRKGEPVETFSVKRGDSASTRPETRPAS